MDVFSAVPLKGNPLAVVIDSSSPDLSQQQQGDFSNWTDLSETTFLFPPTDATKADYKVRIWTPRRELPFAGHPTLGTCKVWLDNVFQKGQKLVSGDDNIVTQECGIGLVKIRKDVNNPTRLYLAAPEFIKYEPAQEEEIQIICKSMDIDRSDVLKAQWTDNGPGWVTLLLKSAQAVLNAKQTSKATGNLNFGLVGPYQPGAELFVKAGLLPQNEAEKIQPEANTSSANLQPATFEVRSIFNNGKLEDPVTGSLNAGIAKWLISEGLAPDAYIASQGTAIGRRGRVYVERDLSAGNDTIWVGGDTCEVISGSVVL